MVNMNIVWGHDIMWDSPSAINNHQTWGWPKNNTQLWDDLWPWVYSLDDVWILKLYFHLAI